MIRTFCIQTLGCRVNQYESEQLATFLCDRGLRPADDREADLRIINTCSVTVQAAGKSRQLARRATGVRVGQGPRAIPLPQLPLESQRRPDERLAEADLCGNSTTSTVFSSLSGEAIAQSARVVVTGCWATSDPDAASRLAGVDAVIGHHQDVAAELARLLVLWGCGEKTAGLTAAPAASHDRQSAPDATNTTLPEIASKAVRDEGWMIKVGAPADDLSDASKSHLGRFVNAKVGDIRAQEALVVPPVTARTVSTINSNSLQNHRALAGTTSLPLLGERQSGRQRAYLKVQDGCDAHCTYCIIPTLRPRLWSKPTDDAVEEANRLVAAGHVELVLTGIFLGAFGQATALRRRQELPAGGPLGELVEALCTRVTGLRRLRLSSLEPGDLTDELVAVLSSHRQVVPHFHLPLQSGSDLLLRRMNRQYTRDDYLRMADRVRSAFDRPALTTDIIVGFPGETDEEFARTLDVAQSAGFIHIHAFSFSPRPGTAAARWSKQFVRGPVVNERIALLRREADAQNFAFRRQFIGETVQVLVERDTDAAAEATPGFSHGRCERYFGVHFEAPGAQPGDFVRVRIDRVSPNRTFGVREQMDAGIAHSTV